MQYWGKVKRREERESKRELSSIEIQSKIRTFTFLINNNILD